jgi:hypothetical protein
MYFLGFHFPIKYGEFHRNHQSPFQLMDNIVHIDEKWFDLTKKNNSYNLHPEEPNPLSSMQNKNSIGKVMFLIAVAKPRYGEGFRATFDGKIGTWAFVKRLSLLLIIDFFYCLKWFIF